ncbi:ATP:cob(I)alamin adenosyltransferase [Patescibacteria group bacterium]|nr:ATP:cob(I)alamin adenosyltransferase [Patescibacteria group bacterium]
MITTKKGDDGKSDYFEKRVSKGGKILEAIGSLDELQAVIQLVSYELRVTSLKKITDDLYLIMGGKLSKDRIEWLEREIGKLIKELKIESKFVIFEKEKALKLNWVRTIVRRAERKVVALRNNKLRISNYESILVYLNRLSDFIYLLALREEEK